MSEALLPHRLLGIFNCIMIFLSSLVNKTDPYCLEQCYTYTLKYAVNAHRRKAQFRSVPNVNIPTLNYVCLWSIIIFTIHIQHRKLAKEEHGSGGAGVTSTYNPCYSSMRTIVCIPRTLVKLGKLAHVCNPGGNVREETGKSSETHSLTFLIHDQC